jgi:hypothetical protein
MAFWLVNSLGIRPPFGNDSTVERGYGDTLGKHYEMDTAMKQDREMAEALRGIINSGFNRSGARLSPASSVFPTWSDQSNRSRLIAIASRIGCFSPHLALLSKQHRSHYAREPIVYPSPAACP